MDHRCLLSWDTDMCLLTEEQANRAVAGGTRESAGYTHSPMRMRTA